MSPFYKLGYAIQYSQQTGRLLLWVSCTCQQVKPLLGTNGTSQNSWAADLCLDDLSSLPAVTDAQLASSVQQLLHFGV